MKPRILSLSKGGGFLYFAGALNRKSLTQTMYDLPYYKEKSDAVIKQFIAEHLLLLLQGVMKATNRLLRKFLFL